MTLFPMKPARRFAKGNAIIEYILPASVVVIGAGVLASTMDVNQLLTQFFASANGDAGSTGTHAASAWGTGSTGAQGTGFIAWSGGSGNSGGAGGSGDGAGGFNMAGAAGGFANGSGAAAADSSGGNGGGSLAVIQGISNASSISQLASNPNVPQGLRDRLNTMAGNESSLGGAAASKTAAAKDRLQKIDIPTASMLNGSVSNDFNAGLNTGSLSTNTLAMSAYAASHPAEMNQYGQAALNQAVNLAMAAKMSSDALAQKSKLMDVAGAAGTTANGLYADSAQTAAIANMPYAQKVGILMGMSPTDALANSQTIMTALAMGITDPNQIMQMAQAASNPTANADCKNAGVCDAYRTAQLSQAAAELSAAQTAALAQANAAAQAAYNQKAQAAAASDAAANQAAMAAYNKACPSGTTCTTPAPTPIKTAVPPFTPITAPPAM